MTNHPQRASVAWVFLLLCIAALAHADDCKPIAEIPDSLTATRPTSRVNFAPGERLEFSVQYGLVNAGHAIMEIDPKTRIRDGRPTYHLITRAESNRMFSSIYKVNDRVESYMDTLELRSVRFEKHLREGKFRKDLLIQFDQERHVALIDGKRECEVLDDVQDVLSSFYYVRTLELAPGAKFYVPNHDNGNNYPMEVTVHGRERISVDAGTFDCLVLEPVVLGEALFNQKGRLRVWVTDDKYKMPVLMKSKVLVGAIAAVLTKFELGGTDEMPPAMVER